MEQRIVFDNGNGGIGVIVPAPGCGLTIEQILAKDAPDGAVIIAASEIPADRTFRDAWRKDGAAVATDLPAARDIAHTARRAARSDRFKPLDIKATIPDEMEQAELDRQVIRDRFAELQVLIDDAEDEPALLAVLADPDMTPPS